MKKQEDVVIEESQYSYKYYLFEDFLPVRVVFKSGLKRAAQVPDAESQGLVNRSTLLSRMDREGFADEIDKVTFDSLCQKEYAKKPRNSLRLN